MAFASQINWIKNYIRYPSGIKSSKKDKIHKIELNLGNFDKTKLKLKNIISRKSYKFTSDGFTLSSGIKSNHYFNMKRTMLDDRGIRLVAEAFIIEYVIPYKITAVGGLESGAIPLLTSLVAYSPNLLKGFYVKKKVKEHGDKKLIEGNLDKDDRILIVDDVITSGGSLKSAIEILKENNFVNICMIAALLKRKYPKKRPIEYLSEELNIPWKCLFEEEEFY